MTIDLRSDTLTQPTEEMKAAMMAAPTGDDVYGEDPSVNALQEYAAALLGMEAALFCPSGTMCNQIGIRLAAGPLTEVICDQYAHIYRYEVGGIAANAGASVRLIAGDRGRLTAARVAAEINPIEMHHPRSCLVSLENTSNKGGGSCYELEEIQAIHALCRQHGLRMHLDGARLFNALVATGQHARQYGQYFDTISICLSKGLGAPVGSLLLCSREELPAALRLRKVMGGGMRQAGYLAAAGLYALKHHISRLEEDHRRARILGQALASKNGIAEVLPVETNIVVFKPEPAWMEPQALIARLAAANIKISNFGGGYLRMVTHLDISDEMIERVVDVLQAC
ncbi:MAG: threonine aldolase [Bacteroidetes bacterium]|nr:MAG: threonine aldolase [Bacteroidota bacterium]